MLKSRTQDLYYHNWETDESIQEAVAGDTVCTVTRVIKLVRQRTTRQRYYVAYDECRCCLLKWRPAHDVHGRKFAYVLLLTDDCVVFSVQIRLSFLPHQLEHHFIGYNS